MEINETAVEFLFRELWQEPKDKMVWYAILDKAKKMEKEQIMDAFQEGKWDWHSKLNEGKESKDPVDYYNETYGK